MLGGGGLAAPAPAAQSVIIPATVGASPQGQTMPSGFVGVSAEYRAIHQYTGRNPDAVNPVLVGLLRGLAPGGSPVLRIGGDSTDWTWWPVRGMIPPSGISYALDKGWMRTTRALAQAAGAKLILGINLASGRPALASAEAQALLHGIGRRNIAALEVGNEPDLYGIFSWYRDRRGRVGFSRSRRYSIRGYERDYARWRTVLPRLPLVAPSFARLTWMSGLSRFLSTERGLGIVSFHRYPLRGCVTDPRSPQYPSQANLLSDAASSGLAQEVAPYVAMAHARRLPFRLDEMNSASCSGAPGLSNTFAAALWSVDALFNMAAVGVDGVNFHTLPGAAYELFSFTQSAGDWSAFVHPEYYGLLMFAQAFPAGARLLPVSVASGPVKVWSTLGPDGRIRVELINKDPQTPVTVQLQLPGSGGAASLERLSAPGLTATDGVSLGGQSFGDTTSSGTLPPPSQETVSPQLGYYNVDLPAASAALLTR
jgi:hypothetical protein